MKPMSAEGFAERQARLWNWGFWVTILAFEAVGVLLARQM